MSTFEGGGKHNRTVPLCLCLVDDDILALGKIQCPGCGEDLEFDMEDCCEDGECDCGCHDHE